MYEVNVIVFCTFFSISIYIKLSHTLHSYSISPCLVMSHFPLPKTNNLLCPVLKQLREAKNINFGKRKMSTWGSERCCTSLSVFLADRGFSRHTIQAPNSAMIIPWPRSPNMMANRKGNVMIVYGAAEKKMITVRGDLLKF